MEGLSLEAGRSGTWHVGVGGGGEWVPVPEGWETPWWRWTAAGEVPGGRWAALGCAGLRCRVAGQTRAGERASERASEVQGAGVASRQLRGGRARQREREREGGRDRVSELFPRGEEFHRPGDDHSPSSSWGPPATSQVSGVVLGLRFREAKGTDATHDHRQMRTGKGGHGEAGDRGGVVRARGAGGGGGASGAGTRVAAAAAAASAAAGDGGGELWRCW